MKPGIVSNSVKTVEPQVGQKWIVTRPPASPVRVKLVLKPSRDLN